MRGTGDAYALRKAYHDEKIHAQLPPASPEGDAVFEAAEQARVEAIGSLAMKGVRQPISPRSWNSSCVAEGLGKARVNRDEAPLADVVGLMVREKLTGEKPPACARSRGRSVAALHRGTRRRGSRQARRRAARPEGVCAAHPHHAATILHWAIRPTRPARLTTMPRAKAREARTTRRRTGQPSSRAKARPPNSPRIARGRRRGRTRIQRRAVGRPQRCRTSRKTATQAQPPCSAFRPCRTNGATRSTPPNSTRRFPRPIFATPRN